MYHIISHHITSYIISHHIYHIASYIIYHITSHIISHHTSYIISHHISYHISNHITYIISYHIYHITSYHIISYHISYHIISYIISISHIMWHHIISHHISYHITYQIISYHIIYPSTSYHIISYHIIYIISHHINISYQYIISISHIIWHHIISDACKLSALKLSCFSPAIHWLPFAAKLKTRIKNVKIRQCLFCFLHFKNKKIGNYSYFQTPVFKLQLTNQLLQFLHNPNCKYFWLREITVYNVGVPSVEITRVSFSGDHPWVEITCVSLLKLG